MKLYNLFLSPFSSRTRVQLYAKGLEAECVMPPGGLQPGGLTADEFREITPLGRVPALEIDGRLLVESTVIAEFLEDRFPGPAPRPSNPLEIEAMRAFLRVLDELAVPPLFDLMGVRGAEVADADQAGRLDDLNRALDLLEHYLDPRPYAVGKELSIADCALVPFGLLFRRFEAFGAKRPGLTAWWEATRRHEACARVLDEQAAAFREAFGRSWDDW